MRSFKSADKLVTGRATMALLLPWYRPEWRYCHEHITNCVPSRPNRPAENAWPDTTTTTVVAAGRNRNSAAKDTAAKRGEATRRLWRPNWAGETTLLFLQR